MRYMMLVATDPEAEAYDPARDNIVEWATEMTRRGISIAGDRLRPVEDATTIRVRDGRLIVTDGPYTESKEWIAGYDIIECADLDEAIEVARQHPMATFGRIELRPLWPLDLTVSSIEREARETAEREAGSG